MSQHLFWNQQIPGGKIIPGQRQEIYWPDKMIMIGLIMPGAIKLNFLSKGNLTDRLSEKFKDNIVVSFGLLPGLNELTLSKTS